MKNAILIGLVCFPLFKLHESKSQVIQRNWSTAAVFTDTTRYAVLKLDSIPNYIFDKNYKPAPLSDAEIIQLEKLISKKVAEINKEERRGGHFKFDYVGNPRKYYKQFIAVVNLKGEKEVWVNCLCDIDNISYFKKDIVLVLDGGSCYFNLKINLTKNTVYDLMINGVA